MAATDSVTVTMTETVSYEITLTHARLAELLDVPVTACLLYTSPSPRD